MVTINGGVTLSTKAFNNNGHVSWDSGNFTASSGATINNLAGGTFDITFDSRLSVGVAPATFTNAGQLRKTAGIGIANLIIPFSNSGNILAQSGTLSLDDGGTHSGGFTTATGATLNFGGGSHTLASTVFSAGSGTMAVSGNATTLSAGGYFDLGVTLNVTAGLATLTSSGSAVFATISVTGGTLLYNSPNPVAVLNLSAGTLGGTSPIVINGATTLSGGTITNALVRANGGLNLSGGFTLNGGKLINPATAIWSAGNFTGANGATFSNLLGATFINTFDGNAPSGAGATPTFVNDGVFLKTNGTAALGSTSIDFTFLNTGTVEVRTNTLRYNINQQTAGLTLLNGGNLTAQAQPLQFSGGSLMGTGLVTVANVQNVVNASAISPGLPVGQLDIAGNYQQTASGNLNIDLGGYSPGTSYDLVTVAAGGAGGVATLAGTLNITLTNGFSPTNGATFTFLTANSRVGAFSIFNYPSNDIGMQLILGTASAAVKVTNLKPVVANPIANPAAITYGSAFNFQFPANTFSDPDGNPLTYTASGMPLGVTFNGATRTFSGSPTQAGVYLVTVAANDGGTPSLTATNTFTLTVNPASLTIAAQPQTKIYGAADPALTFTTSGLQFSDTVGSVLTGALTRAVGETVAASPYAITQGTLVANTNYTISFTGNTLAITKAALSVTADPKTKTYGATDPAFTVTYLGFVGSETPAVLGGTLGFARTPGTNVGSYSITPSGLTSANYAISFNSGSLSITPASLSVTADAKTKTYGATDPAFTVTYAGFVSGETSAVLGGTLAFNRAPGTNVGSYLITPSGLTSGNYSIAFNTGNLSITKAALSVTADAKTKIYGATDPTFTASYTGFVSGETSAVLGGTLAFNRAPGESVGSYLITPSGLTSGNYTITFNTGALAITPAALTITASAKSKTYGATLALNGATDFTSLGLLNGEAIGSVTLTASGSPAGTAATAPAGSYTITPSAATGGTFNPTNYAITYAASTLTVNKAALSVTADAKTKTYGAPDPVFTVTDTGFVNGETAAVLGGTLNFNRAPGENAGSYLITPSGLTSGNYTITFNTGSLSITKAALSVTAAAKTKIYGAAEPPFTASYSGFVNSETPAVLGGTLAFTRAPGENVGNYLITPNGLTSGNYAITFNPGNLSITKAALSVTSDAKTKIYGATDPALTFAVTGLQFTDTAATVLTGSLTRATGETVAGGPYAITQGTLTPNGNYSLNFTSNTLTITKAALSVTADAKTKIYGAVDPTFTATYSGFVNTETPAVLGGTLAFNRVPSENVGSYLITPSGLTSGNYAITFNTGSLSVTKAVLSVTANPITKTYGSTEPALTFTVTGLQFSDTAASVLTGVLTRVGGETVGGSPYTITQGTLTPNGNYTVSFTGNSLTITKAALSVTADAKSKTYGAGDPAFTASYSAFVLGETSAVLGGTLAFNRAPGENVGSYLITPSGLTSGNYALTFNTGTLTITKATLSIAADAKTKTYGTADPALTFVTTGLQFGDTAATVLTGALTRATGETVAGGPYAITQGTLTPNGNYTISFTGNSLAITQRGLAITATGKSKTYGATLTLNGATDFSSTGLQNSETIGAVTLIASGSPAGTAATAAAGSYTITPSAATGGTFSAANYSITYATGTLTVNKAALSVTADAKTKTAGAADPAFSVTYVGFVNGESSTALGGTLTFNRAPGESVGSYLITPSGLTSGNYAITFNPGTLNITAPAPHMLPLTINGSNVTISWNAAVNGNYRIQYQTALGVGNWTDLAGDVTATGSTASKNDVLTSTNRFYRVQVLP